MNFQKLALIIIVILVVGYVGYRVKQAGSFDAFLQELNQAVGRMTPSPSPTPTPSPTRTTPSSTRTPTPAALPSFEGSEVLNTMNNRRRDAGSGTLAVQAVLQREAQEHANDMARRAYFSHDSPEGVTFQQRMGASGYPSTMIAENIGLTSGHATEVVGIWMNSEAHRTNLLNPAFLAAGVGVARGMYQGQPAVYVVAVFGDTR